MAETTTEKQLRHDIRAAVHAGPEADGDRRDLIVHAAEHDVSGLIPDNWNADGSLREPREQRETANDVFAALEGAVEDAFDDLDDYWYIWVRDWYGSGADDDPYMVVFCVEDNLYAAPFSFDEDNKVVLGEPTRVRPVTFYVERAAKPTRRRTSGGLELRKQRAQMLEGVPERRRFDFGGLELRQTSDGAYRFSGYASVTEHEYEVGDFTEIISRTAFKRTLAEDPHVVLLINHGDGGSGLPLASTKSGTLTLSEDARGLRVIADLNPDDPDAGLLIPKMERGDVDEMSFAFRATGQRWNEDYTLRTIESVSLHRGDVSVVTMGANPATTSSLQARELAGALVEMRSGNAPSAHILDVLRQAAIDQGQLDDVDELLATLRSEPDDEPEVREQPASGFWLPADSTIEARQRLMALGGSR